MAKIHPIEKCMCCKGLVAPITKNNRVIINCLIEDLENLIAYPPKNENNCLQVSTGHAIAHEEAGITYYLCPKCCNEVLNVVLRNAIKEDREILFRNFDAIKKELQNA